MQQHAASAPVQIRDNYGHMLLAVKHDRRLFAFVSPRLSLDPVLQLYAGKPWQVVVLLEADAYDLHTMEVVAETALDACARGRLSIDQTERIVRIVARPDGPVHAAEQVHFAQLFSP